VLSGGDGALCELQPGELADVGGDFIGFVAVAIKFTEEFVSCERPIIRLVKVEERRHVFGWSGQLRIPAFGVSRPRPDAQPRRSAMNGQFAKIVTKEDRGMCKAHSAELSKVNGGYLVADGFCETWVPRPPLPLPLGTTSPFDHPPNPC
jgi:hypothetical protein